MLTAPLFFAILIVIFNMAPPAALIGAAGGAHEEGVMTVAETCRMAKEHAAAIAFSSDADTNKMLALAADSLV